MEEVRKFLVERKRSIKLTAIEKWCGIPAGTLRPETRAIPAKYEAALREVLVRFYGFPVHRHKPVKTITLTPVAIPDMNVSEYVIWRNQLYLVLGTSEDLTELPDGMEDRSQVR